MIAELILSIILWRMWHISGPVDNEACRSPSILIRVYLSCSSGVFFQFGFLHTIISSLSYNTWPLGVNSTYGCNLFSWKVKFKFTCQSGFQTIYFVRIELQKKNMCISCAVPNETNMSWQRTLNCTKSSLERLVPHSVWYGGGSKGMWIKTSEAVEYLLLNRLNCFIYINLSSNVCVITRQWNMKEHYICMCVHL